MKKLAFLVGTWSGEARLFPRSGETFRLNQTEEAQYKLDGLLLLIEGIGRSQADGKPLLEALGVISYDDDARVYHMRAYNDGRYLETQIKLTEDGKGMTWGFGFGEIKTTSSMRIDEKGDWTERHEITLGSQPARQLMELRVSPQK